VKTLKDYLIVGFATILTILVCYLVLSDPAVRYGNNKEFIQAVNKCADKIDRELLKKERIPRKLLLAQAALESNYGRSRYALEGNNLMGIYQFKNLENGILPNGRKPSANFRVARFDTKCASVRYYVNLLNTKDFYKAFRNERDYQLNSNMDNPRRYFNLLYNYSTNPEYPELLIRTYKEILALGF
jgi:Bax protein